jgi:acetyl-CoA carboxylase carboxyltransferase component
MDSRLTAIADRRAAAADAEISASAAQRARGALSARERVTLLLDDAGQLVEWGPQAGADREPARGDGVITGIGTVHGRTAIIICYDVSVLSGSQAPINQAKTSKAIDVAAQLSAPVFLLAEGGGVRAGGHPYYQEHTDPLVEFVKLSGRVPLIGVAFGPVFGTRALLLASCDVVIATRAASVELSKPQGESPADVQAHERSGMLDLVAGDDEAAVAAAREYARSMLCPRVPYDAAEDPGVSDLLRAIVPENPRRAFDAEKLIGLLADPGTALLLRRRYGGAVVTALGRVGGRAVGFLANNPMRVAGAIDSPASDKMTRFIRICDTHGLPLVYLVDTPGLLAGPAGERSAMARHSTRPYFALHALRVPVITLTIRRSYGQGGPVMGVMGGLHRPLLQVLWPTAEYGGMGLGGAAAITSSASSRGPDGQSSAQEIRQALVEHGSAENRARRFETDDVIDPGESRTILKRAVALAPEYPVLEPRWPIDAI